MYSDLQGDHVLKNLLVLEQNVPEVGVEASSVVFDHVACFDKPELAEPVPELRVCDSGGNVADEHPPLAEVLLVGLELAALELFSNAELPPLEENFSVEDCVGDLLGMVGDEGEPFAAVGSFLSDHFYSFDFSVLGEDVVHVFLVDVAW